MSVNDKILIKKLIKIGIKVTYMRISIQRMVQE